MKQKYQVIFSSGEKQLLNLTRVMIEDPEIIILDEATTKKWEDIRTRISS